MRTWASPTRKRLLLANLQALETYCDAILGTTLSVGYDVGLSVALAAERDFLIRFSYVASSKTDPCVLILIRLKKCFRGWAYAVYIALAVTCLFCRSGSMSPAPECASSRTLRCSASASCIRSAGGLGEQTEARARQRLRLLRPQRRSRYVYIYIYICTYSSTVSHGS